MKIWIIAVLALVGGIALGVLLSDWYWNTVQGGKRSQGQKTTRWFSPETMKRLVWVCVINGIAWVWCSYILAYLDKPQIAEQLSQVALAEIVVPVGVYAFKSVVENLSKNNRWPDKGGGMEGE